MANSFVISGVRYMLERDRLRIVAGDECLLDVSLTPSFNGTASPLGPWQAHAPNCYKAKFDRGTAIVAELHNRCAFWLEIPGKEQFERLTYLSDGILSGNRWRTFVSDSHDREWDRDVDASVPISSAYAVLNSPDSPPNQEFGGMTDPEDIPPHWIWNIHARAWATKTSTGWLGMSIPGPWGVGITRLAMKRGRFSQTFETIRPSCTEAQAPVVYFHPGLGEAADVLDQHRVLSDELGLTDLTMQDRPDWWANPIFHYWDEWERQANAKTITPDDRHVILRLDEWLKNVQEKTGCTAINIPFEQYCYRVYGDYRAAETFGTDDEVREVVQRWRNQGVHVGHYFHPFLINTKLDVYRDRPEIFCKPKDPNFYMAWALEVWDDKNPKYAPIDWTHPDGRAFMLDMVENLLSDKSGGRDFDILKSNMWVSPDPRHYNFHDPDWGIGDLMTFKVQKLIYERAKKTKPHCMVSKYNLLDPYMQPTCDIIEICEDFTSTTDLWWHRGDLISRCIRNRLMWTSAWFCTRTKWNEYFGAMSAWGIPETEAVTHTTYPYYPSWRPLREEHYRRRKSAFQTYLNAPMKSTDVCRVRVEDEGPTASRQRGEGTLKGFFAAHSISPRCWVSFSESEARVCSTESRRAVVPLPPNAKLRRVSQVRHDGTEADYESKFDREQNSLELYVQDCGRDVLYYRIQYQLGGA